MKPPTNDALPSIQRSEHRFAPAGILLRALLPIGLIALGGYAYWILSVAVEKEKTPPLEKKSIRTRVTEVHAQDYEVVIKKNGIVQPHNEVSLSTEVSGQIVNISPVFEVGSYFDEGEVLVELDARDYVNALAIAEAAHLGAQSALDLANLNYERQTRLLKSNAASKAEVHEAVATRDQAEAQLESLQAQVEQAKQDLERTNIRAPFSGRVRFKSVGLGQSVGVGTPLGIVFAVDFAEVRLPIASRELRYLDLPELADDLPVDVELRDAIDGDSETVWKAKIVRTEGALDENSLEVFAIARVDDPFGLQSGHPPLRIGQPVIGSIAGKVLTDVIAVPRLAVRQLDMVHLIDKTELTLSSKTITPIWSDEEFVIVRDSKLIDGTLLSTSGIVYAPEGAKVELIPEIEPQTKAAANTESKPISVTN